MEDEIPEKSFLEQKELIGYKLINKIGEGAFSKVFRAIPAKNSSNEFLTKNYKAVAIKVIKRQIYPRLMVIIVRRTKGRTALKLLPEIKS